MRPMMSPILDCTSGGTCRLTAYAARDWRLTFFRSASRTPSSPGRMGEVEVGRSKTPSACWLTATIRWCRTAAAILWLDGEPGVGQNRLRRAGGGVFGAGRSPAAVHLVPEPGGQADGD